MKITALSANNPRWVSAVHTVLLMSVQFEHLPDPVEFTAASDDIEAHGR